MWYYVYRNKLWSQDREVKGIALLGNIKYAMNTEQKRPLLLYFHEYETNELLVYSTIVIILCFHTKTDT
jgi:hypothetical protein